MYIRFYTKQQLFLSDFNENFSSVDRILKNTKMSNFVKIHPMEAEFHADRRTDMQQSRFSLFCERA